MDDLALRSALLSEEGFEHAFFSRHARIDDVVFGTRTLFQATQVHGDVVLRIDATSDVKVTRAAEADALVSVSHGHAAGVRTADCVPLLLADRNTGFVAAVHAGWKGVAACIAERALEALVREGAHASGIVAAIGPHIRACCFEVGVEVIDKLDASSGVSTARPGARGKPHAEMVAALRAQLARAGVESVDDVGGCTMCDAERFFSYRRDGALAGRLVAAIAPR